MAWFRIALTDAEQTVVNSERDIHPEAHVRRKMLVLWLLHCGLTRAQTGEVTDLGRATVQRYVAAYRDGGLDGLRQWDRTGPLSALAEYTELIRASLVATLVRTVAEACDQIETRTGIRRQPTQVRDFLTGLGFCWRRVRAVPVPSKKVYRNTSRIRGNFSIHN